MSKDFIKKKLKEILVNKLKDDDLYKMVFIIKLLI